MISHCAKDRHTLSSIVMLQCIVLSGTARANAGVCAPVGGVRTGGVALGSVAYSDSPNTDEPSKYLSLH